MQTANAEQRAHRRHPGSGRGKTRRQPKGRQVDPAALDEVRTLLGDRPRDRDLLIEHLHLIQDRWRCISAPHLAALAHEMRLSMAEVYETATFYAHFDVLAEGEAPPPAVTVRVCDSLSCELAGAQALLESLPAALGEGVRVVRAPCMGRCDIAPVAEVGHRHVDHVDEAAIRAVIEAGDLHPVIPEYRALDAYEQDGGYTLLRACLAGEHTFEDIAAKLDAAGLRGLGGAGFPTGRKWRIVRGYEGPRLMAVDADEGEPGTFKDRYYMERDPHRFLEGVLVAAWAVEAEAVYIYLRDEYPFIREILLREMAKLGPAGLDAHTTLHLRRGAGAYICGEESSMIESIEGKRGLPRHRPPVRGRGRGVRAPDPGPERGDDVLGSRHRGEGSGVVREPRPERWQGPAQLLGVGTGEVAGGQARAGRRDAPRAGRRVLRRNGGRTHAPRLSARRCLRRHPAGLDGGPAARIRQAGAARELRGLARGGGAFRPR